MQAWGLPPNLTWPAFLRLLRHPSPPKGWLEMAAEVPDVARKPLLLRWIAQHMKCPAHLRARLLPRLPWRAQALIANDASAHPQARHQATERLQSLWPVLSMGERRSLALFAPKPLWPMVWKTPDTDTLAAFLQHPKLGLAPLLALIQPPLGPAQAEALAHSRWRGSEALAIQVLIALNATLDRPDSGMVPGHAVPWVLDLGFEARLDTANRMTHPFLRRLVRARKEVWDPGLPPSPEDLSPR